jgi:hypothetical protein
MATTVIDVPRFEPANFPKCGFVLALAKRGSGKSVYCAYMASKLPFVETGMAMSICGSEKVCQDWRNFIPKLYVHAASLEVLDMVIRNQNRLAKHFAEKSMPIPDALHMTLFIDDCASIPLIMKSKQLKYLASNSRHLNMCIILAAQYFVQVVREIRSQFDITMLLGKQTASNIKTVNDDYATCVDLRTFRAVVISMLKDFGVLIIDSRSDAMDLLSFDKAPFPLPEIKLGNPQQWEFSRQHFLDLDRVRDEHKRSLQVTENVDIEEDEDGFNGDVTAKDEDNMLGLGLSNDAFHQLANNRIVVHDSKGKILILKTRKAGFRHKEKED